MTTPKVSIIVPTYNRDAILKETLDCLSHLDYPQDDYELIVVDDGSSDETAEVTRSFEPKIKNLIYHLKKNGGASSARNEGARIAKGDVLLFNDDDILVEPTMIKQHLGHLSRNQRSLVGGHWDFSPKMLELLNQSVFGKYRIAVEDWVKEANNKEPLYDNCYRAMSVSSQNFSIYQEDFWEIGAFDSEFPYAGFEDHEFTQRALKAGYTLLYDFDIKLLNNDLDRADVIGFSERQRRGAIVKILLAHKHPEQCMEHPMIVENAGIKYFNEPFELSAKKLAKNILATRPGLSSILSAAKLLDKVRLNRSVAAKLYDIACGLYIFRGIQEGIKLYGEPDIYHPVEDAAEIAQLPYKTQRKFTIKEVK